MQHTVIYDIATGAIVDTIAWNATLSGLGVGLATMRVDCTGTETNISEVTPAPVNPSIAKCAKLIAKQFAKVGMSVPASAEDALAALDGLPDDKHGKAIGVGVASIVMLTQLGGDWSHVLAEAGQ